MSRSRSWRTIALLAWPPEFPRRSGLVPVRIVHRTNWCFQLRDECKVFTWQRPTERDECIGNAFGVQGTFKEAPRLNSDYVVRVSHGNRCRERTNN